jgi:hypothetical protein
MDYEPCRSARGKIMAFYLAVIGICAIGQAFTASPTPALVPPPPCPPAPLDPDAFRAAWFERGAAALAAEERMGRAVEQMRGLVATAQGEALRAREEDYPHFALWVERAGWEDVQDPPEFWGEAARRAAPGFRVYPMWYNTPSQYVYVVFYAD